MIVTGIHTGIESSKELKFSKTCFNYDSGEANRQKPKYIKEKLSDFGKCFLDDHGHPVPTPTLSDILKEKEKWLNLDTESDMYPV